MEGPSPKKRENLLESYIPTQIYELVSDLCSPPVYIYRHKPTGLPMACAAGGHAGDIIGGIIYYRDPSNSLNMEIEAPMDQMMFTFKFLQQMIGKPENTSVECVWYRFLSNITNRLFQKAGFSEDGPRVPMPFLFGRDEIDDETENVKTPADSEATEATEAPEAPKATEVTNEDETHEDETDDDACLICEYRKPDTTVMPCLHRVVCQVCSPLLEQTADAKTCCRCRNQITGIFYPDNSFRPK